MALHFENKMLLIADLSRVFDKTWNDHETLIDQMADEINYLINNDFNKLMFILYKVDVSEEKVRAMLQDKGHSNTGKEIAYLLIKRQLEKIEKRSTGNGSIDIPEDEKW